MKIDKIHKIHRKIKSSLNRIKRKFEDKHGTIRKDYKRAFK